MSRINFQAFSNKFQIFRPMFRIGIHSGPIGIPIYVSQPMRSNTKNILNLVYWKMNPTQSVSIRDSYPNESKRIRGKFPIRMIQNQSGRGLISNPNESV